MHPSTKLARLYVCLGLIVIVAFSGGLHRVAAAAGDDEMVSDDICAGDMVWMVGWCLDGVMPDESVTTLGPSAAAAPAQAGVFETINVPGASGTRAFGINARGDIVGSYTVGSGSAAVTHAYLLSNGVLTTIDVPGAVNTEAWGINPRGDIIGRYTLARVPGMRGFLLSHGVYTDISIRKPDGTYHVVTLPTKIGASGDIVGCFHDVSGLSDMYGYIQRGSNVSTFALPTVTAPTGSSAMHNGITPGGGVVVGLTFPTGPTSRGYVVTKETFTLVDFPGSTFTQLWDLNPDATVVGQYALNGRTKGFSLDANGYHTIDVPSSTMTVARGINPEGDIVGVYNTMSGNVSVAHGFVLRK
jgi:uncharacterized membrane protein